MTNVDPQDPFDALRRELLADIDRNARGKISIRLKKLMAAFGYTATQRVRQTSLAIVLETLAAWGIDYRLPNGASPDTSITLSRAARPVSHVNAGGRAPVAAEIVDVQVDALLPLLYWVGETRDEARSRAAALDLQNALWAFRPACLLVAASDEFFALLCGFIGALMRRRALMLRSFDSIDVPPLAPELISLDRLKYALGRMGEPGYTLQFPHAGAVYILREQPDDIEDDELVAAIRDSLLPDTYRLDAKFATTSGDRGQGARVADSSEYDTIIRWMAMFAGTQGLPLPSAGHLVDLASLFAEATQLRETLIDRQALTRVDPQFSAGFESTEHMAIKSAALNGLRTLYPHEQIVVEQFVELRSRDDDELAPDDMGERSTRAKPDLRIGNRIWVEVETVRGLARRGSNPFFALESKLRKKIAGIQSTEAFWLIVPSDVALLAHQQLSALARNLNAALQAEKVRIGFIDMASELPVFLQPTPVPSHEPRLVGASWRQRPQRASQPLTWADIAGYADIKARLHDDLLDPLLNADRYAQFGALAANGLLLYGLPGCGKSLIGQVLASVAGLTCRLVMPSDLTSMWLGEGVGKIRALFDWALKQAPCLLVLDELDAIAPQRQEGNMHTDEKRQVNELLAQLSRIADRGVVVVGTTNYVAGIDGAIVRSGRFDIKLPVFPPTENDRREILQYYLSEPRLRGFGDLADIDIPGLAAATPLYTPADLRTLIQAAARRGIRRAADEQPPLLTNDDLKAALRAYPRSIRKDQAEAWLEEVAGDLNPADSQLCWLREEIARAFEDQTVSAA